MIDKKLIINEPARLRVKLFDYQSVSEDCHNRTLPITNPVEYKNLFCENGALLLGYGMTDILAAGAKPFPINDTANISMKYYKGKDGSKQLLLAYHTTHGCFVADMSKYSDSSSIEWKLLSIVPYRTAEEFRINGENILLLAAGNDLAKYDGETFTRLGNASPTLALAQCNHFGRMFLSGMLDNYELRFSDEIDPLNFNVSAFEGGFINVDIDCGGIIKLISMNEYLYIILERGIMRLRAYGDQSEFQLKKLDVYTGDIIASTVAKCGGKIMFVSSAGLMAFDGYNCTAVHEELKDKLIKNLQYKKNDIHVEYCYNTYFLSYWINRNKTEILAVDLSKNNYSFIESNLQVGMVKIDREGEELVLYNTYESHMFAIKPIKTLKKSIADKGVIKGVNIDFNEPNRTKTIKTIEVPEGLKGKLIISNAVSPSKTVELFGDKLLPINIAGKTFNIELQITSKTPCYSPVVNIEMQRGS